MEEKEMKKNKMGTQAINKVLLGMGVPIICSMVLQAMYNIIDSMFVANIPQTGELAVNALTLAFPIQMLMVAFSIGTGVGVNALLARYLGEGKKEKVGQTAGNGITLGIIICAVFVVFSIFGLGLYFQSQTSDAQILAMGKRYLWICSFFGFGNILFGIYEKLLQATGKTIYSTVAQITGALINIVLDPILIFGWFGLPAMDVAGAAYATVLGQIASLGMAMYFHYKKNREVPNGLAYLRLDKKIVSGIYKIGVPAIIMQALMSFMTYGINILFASVSVAAVTAYGIFYKVQQFILFAAFGLRDAITPLVSYNNGMNDRKRVQQTIRYGLLYTSILMVAGTLVIECFGGSLTAVFALSPATEALCLKAMRIVGVSFLFMGINVALQGVFQGLNHGMYSLVISLVRLLVVPLPLAIVFSHMADAETMIWFSFVIAEILAAGIALVFLKRA